MKKFVASLVLLLTLLSVFSTAGLSQKPVVIEGAGLQRAVELFIPIFCTGQAPGPDGQPTFVYHWRIGTGFPVGKHLVLTAKHINCQEAIGPSAITEISIDGGVQFLPVNQMFNHRDVDAQLYVVPEVTFEKPAEFRAPILGEKVTSYGQANGEQAATYGQVMRLTDPAAVMTSQPGIGGMSGSAIVAEDGKVVGMTCLSVPFFVGPDVMVVAVAMGPTGLLLQSIIETFPKE